LLERVELFSVLSDEEREYLAEGMEMRLFAAKTRVIEQRAAGDSMLVIFEGLLNIMVQTSENEEPLRVGSVAAGNFLGEMSLLTGEPRSASALAATDVVAFEVSKAQVEHLLSERPELVESLGRVAAERQLRNQAAFVGASKIEQEVQRATLANQIVGRVRTFFSGVFEQPNLRHARLVSPVAPNHPTY
jgi:CRP-like cAMP-binding protein